MKINIQSKAFWKILSILMLLGVFFTFNQCVVSQYDAPVITKTGDDINVDDYHDDPVINSGTLPQGGSGEFEETGATEVARLVTDVGIKDFESIYMTFQVLTGIESQNDSTVRSSYNDLQSQLPTDTSVKNFLTANQIAIIKLASTFCDRLFSSSSYYNGFFNNFSVTSSPQNVLDTQNKKLIMVQDFINRFWGQNVQPYSVEETAKIEMINLIDDLLVGESMTSSNTTRLVAKGVCTSMLASAPVTTL